MKFGFISWGPWKWTASVTMEAHWVSLQPQWSVPTHMTCLQKRGGENMYLYSQYLLKNHRQNVVKLCAPAWEHCLPSTVSTGSLASVCTASGIDSSFITPCYFLLHCCQLPSVESFKLCYANPLVSYPSWAAVTWTLFCCESGTWATFLCVLYS